MSRTLDRARCRRNARVSGGDYGIVVVVAVVAAFALLVAGFFGREVLAADQGTDKMQDISRAVQEGAAAYLRRQFTTLAPFAVIIFVTAVPAAGGHRPAPGSAGRSSSSWEPPSRRSSGSPA